MVSVGKLPRRSLFAFPEASPEAFPRPAAAESANMVHIASLLVQVVPRHMALARHAALALPGAEIHDPAVPGKFVVVLESPHERALADATQHLLDVRGVICVSLVAHMMESEADLRREA
jgi:nitrate reductase NapD